MNEELLSRSSQNIATLLQIVLLHEENLSRLSTQTVENNPLGDLINIVFTNENLRRNTRNQARNEARNQARNEARNDANNIPATPSNNRTRNTQYSEHVYSDIISPIYVECPITQEPFQESDRVVMITSCRHLFKRDPFHEWITISQTCPYCRSPL